MIAVITWINSSRLRPRSDRDVGRLVHPPSTLIVGAVSLTFFAWLMFIGYVTKNETFTWWVQTCFGLFALLSAVTVVAFFMEKHDVSSVAIRYPTLLRGMKSMHWADVAALRYNPLFRWFHLRSRSGDVARVSAMLKGLPEFARLALDHVAGEAIDAATAELLMHTAEGNPP